MSDLRELYQEMILDHGKNPRNRCAMDDADDHADGHNPLCGDRLKVFVRRSGDRLDKISFEGSGCAISMASASMMTLELEGKTKDEARQTFEVFLEMVTGKLAPDQALPRLGKLAVFSGVCNFPVRIKCATLPWHTLRAALTSEHEIVSTE